MVAHIHVIKPGLMTSVQDYGRYGYQKYGVVVGGAVDSYAAQIANLLVGNTIHESVLEMTLQGPTLTFDTDVLVAICGGDMSPKVDSETLPLWRPLFLRAGTTIEFEAARTGCRSYLAIAGGFDVADVLGSKSTFIRGGFGGYHGRMLREGDVLETLPMEGLSNALVQSIQAKGQSTNGSNNVLASKWSLSPDLFSYIPDTRFTEGISVRVLVGPEYNQFDLESQSCFFTSMYQVTPKSDRMGCRLRGPKLRTSNAQQMISDAVTAGTIQVPPDGQPIVLLADRQTTGGYPRIAQVATVDLARVGQAKPGASLFFQRITLADAQQLYIERIEELEKLKLWISYYIRHA